MKIFCDHGFNGEAKEKLAKAVAPHELLFPKKAATSVLDSPAPDFALAEADIAFGQPDAKAVLGSDRLKWVQVTSAGYTRYDTAEFRDAAKDRGLIFTNSSSVFAEACAEHVLSFMLAQARLLPVALQTRVPHHTNGWKHLRGASSCLKGQTVVILGYGAIAARLVELLCPFQMKISSMRRRPKGDESVETFVPGDLAATLADADHVVDILPDNEESRHFIDSERLGWMKSGAIFYNIGRGTTVDQTALAAALRSGRLGAAWLDVTEPEPLPDGHPLLSASNCHITPHTAGGHLQEDDTLIEHFVSNFRLFLENGPLSDRVM